MTPSHSCAFRWFQTVGIFVVQELGTKAEGRKGSWHLSDLYFKRV